LLVVLIMVVAVGGVAAAALRMGPDGPPLSPAGGMTPTVGSAGSASVGSPESPRVTPFQELTSTGPDSGGPPQDEPETPAPTARHLLRVVTHPDGAGLVVRVDGETVRTGKTPFRARLLQGTLQIRLAMPGHNVLIETVRLTHDRRMELWLDPKGLLHHKIGEFTTGSLPKQVAFSPDGTELWVTTLGESGIEVYDVATLERIEEIDSGRYGTVEVLFTPNGRTVFVSQMQTASVFEIDRRTYRIRRRLETGSSWSKIMALSPDGRRLYVSNWVGDDVTEFDLATGEVRRQIATVDTPRGLYVTEDGKRLFVAGYGNGELQRIYLRSGDSRILLTTGGAMRHLVADPARGVLFANDMATSEAFVVDLETERVRKLADTDQMPNSIDLSPDGRVLYVSNRGENNPVSYGLPGPEWGSVLAVDTRTGRLLDAIVGGNQATGLDVSPDGRLLAFSDFLDNRVSVYEIPPYPALRSGAGGRVQEHYEDIRKEG
jgi:YVTN family beta-propeller protein